MMLPMRHVQYHKPLAIVDMYSGMLTLGLQSKEKSCLKNDDRNKLKSILIGNILGCKLKKRNNKKSFMILYCKAFRAHAYRDAIDNL